MNGMTHMIKRTVTAFALALLVAAFAVPAAGANDRIVDDYFRDTIRTTAPADDRIVDDYFRDAPAAVTYSPTDRIVDDSFRDVPAGQPVTYGVSNRIVDDSFRDAPAVIAAQPSARGFHWGDFGIGAAAMLGLVLLATGLGLGALSVRHRGGQLGTS